MNIYKVSKGKGKFNINNIILENATQEELKHFYLLGVPYVEVEKEKPKKAKKKNEEG
jgi:hypothetical protein